LTIFDCLKLEQEDWRPSARRRRHQLNVDHLHGHDQLTVCERELYQRGLGPGAGLQLSIQEHDCAALTRDDAVLDRHGAVSGTSVGTTAEGLLELLTNSTMSARTTLGRAKTSA
jgi:hypothetical protein